MHVLFVLIGSLFLYRALGFADVELFETWLSSARAALATMFLVTATSHFAPMRRDLVAMVPPGFPRPDLLVLITGIAELAGAVGLMIPATTYWAACGLIVLLVLMLPANISAARRNIPLRGRRVTPLWLRVPMQVLFIVWVWIVRCCRSPAGNCPGASRAAMAGRASPRLDGHLAGTNVTTGPGGISNGGL